MPATAHHGSQTLAYFDTLSPARRDALQLDRLRPQLARVYRASAFYRAKMDQAGLRPEDVKSLADFARIPTSNKAEFLRDQQAAPPFGTRLAVPRESVVMVNMTGGTSGQGQEVYGRTHHDIALQGHLHYLPWFLAGLRPGDVAFNFVPQGGLTTGGWGPPEGLRVAGATAIHTPAAYSTDAKIGLMLRIGEVNFIYSSTNFLHTLTDGLRRRNIAPAEAFPRMHGILIAGEGYPSRWAQSMTQAWGCTLHEGYGSTQGAGFIASTCERGAVRADGKPGHLHVFEWENLIEVVHPESGQPVAPGEEGEIVLTNLSVLGSPVVRFATGDKARLLPIGACGCGRRWCTLEAGSIGRYDDMMKIRGNNVWPSAVDAVVFAHPEVAEYAGSVSVDTQGRTNVVMRLAMKPDVCDAAAAQALCTKLAAQLKDKTNVRMELAVVPRAELPVFDYKARRWTDERQKGYGQQTTGSQSGSRSP